MKKIVFIFLLLAICARVYGQSIASEDSLKAAYIFHFINFTEWSDNLEDYYVCVPDDESLKNALEASFTGKIINNRKIVILHNAQVCHVLISNEPSSVQTTLTIGPLSKGALLEFRLINNKLKFAVNLERVKKSKLKISSQLLKLGILDNTP